MRAPSSNQLLWVTLLLAAGMIGYVVWKADPGQRVLRVGFQDADAPLGMPSEEPPDHRFRFTSAWDRVQFPVAHRFDPPLGTEHGAFAYNAQDFREPNAARGGPHLGDDLNGIGGMNSDLGDPVHAAADGWVVYAGEPSNGWGNVIVLAHRTPEGRDLQTMYAHLDRIDCPIGSLIGRGATIGTVGTAHGNYPAHLHFEIRDGQEVDIGAGYSQAQLNRLDPSATIEASRNALPWELSPSPLGLALNVPDETPTTVRGVDSIPKVAAPGTD